MQEQKKAQTKQCYPTDGGAEKVMPTKQEKRRPGIKHTIKPIGMLLGPTIKHTIMLIGIV